MHTEKKRKKFSRYFVVHIQVKYKCNNQWLNNSSLVIQLFWKLLSVRRSDMFNKILYIVVIVWLIISFIKDKSKTKIALKKAWKSFENILPSVLAVLFLIGLILSVLDENTISRLLGEESGVLGMVIAAIIGSITLIPGFVAFPLAASLLQAGAGYAQIAMFISALMMVGIATLPLESKYFGKKIAIKRNLLALGAAIVTSCLIGVIMI